MRSIIFIGITLLAGFVSGIIYGGINLLAVEPFIEDAIGIEIENKVREGESIDLEEVDAYRLWQKKGSVLAGIMLGIASASLFAIVYAYTRSGSIKRGVMLASILWVVIFLVPFIKYPANPPAVGDPETIAFRQTLYIASLSISGLSALVLALLYRYMGKKRGVIVIPIYVTLMVMMYLTLPPNPDTIEISMDLVNSFRIVSALTSLAFWLILGSLFSILSRRFNIYARIRNV